MKEPFTIEQLETAAKVIDALHTKAASECKVRTAQGLTLALSVVHAEITRITSPLSSKTK